MSSRGRKMQLKLVHAASSGIVIALVLSLLLVPSIWEMTNQPQPVQVAPFEEKGGRGDVADSDVAPLPAPAPSPESTKVPAYPPTLGVGATVGTALSIIVVVVVLFSFLLVRRVEE